MAQPTSAVARVSLGHVHDSDAAPPSENIVQHPADDFRVPTKRRRRDGTEAPRKRRRDEQRGLCELNLDELYIIFAYIYPMDLLNLARTCKYLRGVLMHRSSLFLWKTALRQIEGLPPCPTDLVEPEYTNLVFSTRCHGCGEQARSVLWRWRRRYCPACRAERRCHLRSCDAIIRFNAVLPVEQGSWVDRDQVDSFMNGYHSSTDKAGFLNEKRKQCQAICSHARRCKYWQREQGRVHRFDLEVLRKERQASIFERLEQRGYGPEIAYFRDELIIKSNRPIFKKHNPLMDSEWVCMWPAWVKVMDNFRSQRLEATLYQPRRRLLVSEYDKYVMCSSRDSPALDFLPHVVDLIRLPLFRNIIRACEDGRPDDKLFASAFAQLPTLVDEWTQKLNSEIAALVKVPSCLTSSDVFGSWDVAPSNAGRTGSLQTNLDKLRLACAVFHVGGTGAFAHPEVLSVSMGNDMTFANYVTSLDTFRVAPGSIRCEDNSERTGSIYDRFGLQFLDEAPYIVYACGLDPSVATVDDMNRRNARLNCLVCGGRTLVMNWRHAMWHARFYHCISFGLSPLSQFPRWQLVGDEHIDAIEAVERSMQKAFSPDWTRCLLCRPRVGDATLYDHALRHLLACHSVEKDDIKEGVHYKLVGIRDVCVVEMVERGGEATFRILRE